MALNKVIIMGRITHHLELKQTSSGKAVLSFSIAVDRYSKDENEKTADFFNCVAWDKQAEFISKYFDKGRLIALVGKLQTRSYEGKDGTKKTATEIIVDNAEFTGEKPPQAQQQNYAPAGYAQPPQGAGYAQGYSGYAPQTQQPVQPPPMPQAPAQNPNGYPSPYMCAPPNTQQAQNAAEYGEFMVFGGDDLGGVPF